MFGQLGTYFVHFIDFFPDLIGLFMPIAPLMRPPFISIAEIWPFLFSRRCERAELAGAAPADFVIFLSSIYSRCNFGRDS